MDYDLDNNFTYHPPRDGFQLAKYEFIRDFGRQMASFVSRFCPRSREQALALTKIEEAVMWANAALARHEEGVK